MRNVINSFFLLLLATLFFTACNKSSNSKSENQAETAISLQEETINSRGTSPNSLVFAEFENNEYRLTKPLNNFANDFNNFRYVTQQNGGSDLGIFQSFHIDDSDPEDKNSLAYFCIVTENTNNQEVTTYGIKLQKQKINGKISLTIPENFVNGYREMYGGEDDDEADAWKCTSTGPSCGGCIKVKQRGRVVGCDCTSNSNIKCGFERTGGGGTWITPLITGVIGIIIAIINNS